MTAADPRSCWNPASPVALPLAIDKSYPSSRWSLWLAIILAIGPFIVRRIVLLGDDNFAHWLAIDYLARCISLTGVIFAFRSGLVSSEHTPASWRRSLQVMFLLVVAECAEQVFGYPLLRQHFHFMETTSWPAIPDPVLRLSDLSVGLLFDVYVEEMVFRRFLFSVIETRLPQFFPVVFISAAIFGLVHFTSSVADTMLNAFIHGLFLGIAYWTTRRLSICVASHYLVDLLIFIGR